MVNCELEVSGCGERGCRVLTQSFVVRSFKLEISPILRGF